jgi:hypothetical protein
MMKTLLIMIAALAVTGAFAQGADGEGSCCGSKPVAKKVAGDDAFMAQAHQMMMQAEGKMECCKSTSAHPMARGDKGCCNETGVAAKFKVYALGHYHYYGCKDSAAQARRQMRAQGIVVGNVQKVRSRVKIG